MNKYMFFITLIFLLGCNRENKTSKTDPVDQDVLDMIYIPDQHAADSAQIAKINFSQLTYNFDTVDMGTVVQQRYAFKNTGKVNLLIHSVKSTCGCTATEWPKDPIEPGDSSSILVTFDTKERLNYQNKPIFVLSNAIPNQVKLELNGFVVEKEYN